MSAANVRAGDLTHRCRIEKKQESQSASGAVTHTWVLQGYAWCDIQPLTGKEFMAAQQMTSKVDAKVTMRIRSDITANMRLVFGATIYDILAIMPDRQFNDHLTLMVASGATAG